MPRKNPFPKREREICKRLREFRSRTKLSRVAFAGQSGLDVALLRSYESARSRLNYIAAHKVICAFGVNPTWLATGNGPMVRRVMIPTPAALKVGPRAVFSDVYDYRLLGGLDDYQPLPVSGLPESNARWLVWHYLRNESYSWLGHVPEERLDQFRDAILRCVRREVESYGYQSDDSVWNRLMEMDARELAAFPGLNPAGEPGVRGVASPPKMDLTDAESTLKVPGEVKPQLPNLLERLKRATAQPGKKSALADWLAQVTGSNVPLASVSRWLSGEREPGGEVTLLLLKWVELQEGKPK